MAESLRPDSRPVSIGELSRLVRAIERLSTAVGANAIDLEKLHEEQRVQMKRIAQMQVELDTIKRTRKGA